ncbi:MAG: glycoside hydrolase family 26 protein [Natronosporangium sp.]
MRRSARAVVAAVLCGVVAGSAGCTAAGRPGPNSDRVPAPDEVTVNAREFGILSDPWQVDEWADAVGAAPTMVMEFEQWHRNRTIDDHFAQARRQGLDSFMVAWEPWRPVPPSLGKAAQYADQPEYGNAAIAAGRLDGYIRDFARSVAASGLAVYIRYAHEMNGDWYPWSRDPDSYVLAWRRVVDIFRAAGATNATFVFSLNASIWVDDTSWREVAEQYWPGDGYVDLVGATMISFGGRKDYTVAEFAARLELMREVFGKDVMVTELNTAAQGRVRWLTDLRTWLAVDAPWVTGVVLAQAESRGQIQLGEQVGDLSWNVMTDPETQPVIRGLIDDLTGAPAR